MINYKMMFIVLILWNGYTLFAEDRIELIHEERGRYTVTSDSSIYIDIPIFAKIKPREYLCLEENQSDFLELEITEMKLELQAMIELLNQRRGKPMLSENQRVFLSKVPSCEPFITEVKAITLMLRGYKLLKTSD
jgi:hypothetical protein